MSGRRTNLALLVLVPATAAVGLFANTIGSPWAIHPAVVHGAMGLAVLALAPWKSMIMRRGLGRRPSGLWRSVTLLAAVLVTVSSGLLHATDAISRIGPVTVMQVHVGGGLVAVAMVWLHFRMHPVRLRTTDLDRRAVVRTGGLVAAAAVLWGSWETALAAVGAEGAERRSTGSHPRGRFEPNRFPVTSWLNDRTPITDGPWEVDIDGRVSVAADLTQSDVVEAVLDCTSGWYTTQEWKGVRLDRVMAGDGRSIEVVSATGYARRFPMRDRASLYLVTHVGDEPLTPGHGAPLRLVAPGRRGFWWVKWVVAVRSSDVPWWVQLPFPAT